MKHDHQMKLSTLEPVGRVDHDVGDVNPLSSAKLVETDAHGRPLIAVRHANRNSGSVDGSRFVSGIDGMKFHGESCDHGLGDQVDRFVIDSRKRFRWVVRDAPIHSRPPFR